MDQVNSNYTGYDFIELIPVASTFKSLFDLFLKYVFSSCLSKQIKEGDYYSHIRDKNFLVHIAAFIPILGNIALAIAYLWNKHHKSPPESTPESTEESSHSPEEAGASSTPLPSETIQPRESEPLPSISFPDAIERLKSYVLKNGQTEISNIYSLYTNLFMCVHTVSRNSIFLEDQQDDTSIELALNNSIKVMALNRDYGKKNSEIPIEWTLKLRRLALTLG